LLRRKNPRDQGEEKTFDIYVLKPAEINSFLDATEDEKHHTLFMLAIMSGCRQRGIIRPEVV